ncbi:uncharacterized protein L3040_006702 [Drepanopeziza brunnea f. sp. 'multigermtubi']|uniref:uncharacterized protein n=1 Tax=Drepanopeziza brunnea f. sp. 'multigermtubi' TaxID=698441 RepID=UPI0023A71085|nr:hypothetical protein L3040_006702 [Drepanopeziza brunnea f. sp. 'multigermtubi']
MLFTNAIVAAAVLAASVVTAAPAEVATRNERTIKLCRNKNWDSCTEAPAPPGKCQNTADTGSMNDQISSLDTYGYTCFLFHDVNCVNSSGYFSSPGTVKNLKTDKTYSDFQDSISSYYCN